MLPSRENTGQAIRPTGCSFAEHLLDWVAGDQMDKQENERDDYPDGLGQGYAGEDRLHGSLQTIKVLGWLDAKAGAIRSSPTPFDCKNLCGESDVR